MKIIKSYGVEKLALEAGMAEALRIPEKLARKDARAAWIGISRSRRVTFSRA